MADKLEQVAIRMVEQPPLYSNEPMNNPDAAIRVMNEFLSQMDRELFCIVNLQADLTPINMNIVSVGSLNEALINPREIFKSAILSNAHSMMLIHNHPSGNLTPSTSDIQTTARMQELGELMGISLVDHIITGRNGNYYSFRDKGEFPDSRVRFSTRVEDIDLTKGMVTEATAPYEEVTDTKEKGDVRDIPTVQTATIPLPVQGKDMDSIMQSLESGVEELFTSNRYQEFLKTMAKFHNYSFNNTMLIAMQRPDATLVTSYKNWQSMGRQVMKGEKGITIIAPAPYKKMKEKEVLDENQRPIMGTDGKPKTEQVEVTVPHFKAVTVFDIAQTSGEPIQTLAPELLTAAVQDFDSFMQAIQKISPVPIRFDEIDGNANGYYHNADKEIVIKKGLSESQTLKTAIHETAHAKLHDKEIMESLGVEKDRLTKEVEAESVAYCVCSSFGLDTSDYSFPYIAGWSSSREMKEMKASMDVIRKTAGEMIDQLTEELEIILEEKQKTELHEKYGILVDAMEAAGYRYDYRESEPGHIVLAPDGTHEIAGYLQFESWGDIQNWLEDTLTEGTDISERVDRAMYPFKYDYTLEEEMFRGNGDRYAIYHVDEDTPGKQHLFMNMAMVKEDGITIDAANYKCVYSGRLHENEKLDDLYAMFNDNPPADYKAHSMSVSDVIITNRGGDMQAYYVDRFGFAELPNFAAQREKILDIVPDIENVDYENNLTCISFYAAECAEFPVMGEVHYDLTLPEALEAYEKIPSERMHGLKCVGFDLKDGSNYEGMQSLMIEGKIQKDFLNSIPGFRENSYVQNAISRVEKYLEERHPNVENPLKSNKKVDNEKNISEDKYYYSLDLNYYLKYLAGFIRINTSGALIAMETENYQIDGKKGNWIATDTIIIDGKQFYLMEHQVYRDQAQGVILDAYGKRVVEECKKFDEKTKQKIHDYIQQQIPLNPVEQLKQDGKICLEHYQKFYQNGTYERSREFGTEANYDMVDGLVNNQKKNPEKISDARSNKQTSRNQQDGKPKKRRSVIK